MRKNVFVALLILGTLLAGCATLPKPEEMKADISNYMLPKLPDTDKAIVYIVRPSGAGAIIRFNVFLDDKEADSEMGYTRGGQYIYFNVKPGVHQILSLAENWAAVNITAKAGDIIYIQQETSIGIIMARNNLRILPEYEGKYQVKRLIPGTIKKTDK